MKRDFLQPAMRLTLFATAAVSIVMLLATLTAEKRDHEAQTLFTETLRAVAPNTVPENYVWQALAYQPTPSAALRKIYPIYLSGVYHGSVIEIVAHDGYSGDIQLLAGVDATDNVHAVQVLAHRETPGLGDRIERHKSDWLHGLVGLSARSEDTAWQLKGRYRNGNFDQLTGATVTAKAVLIGMQQAVSELQPQLDTAQLKRNN